MGANEPEIFVRGIDKVIKRDLDKHMKLLEQSKLELVSYKLSRSQLIQRKKHYRGLIGKSKYNDEALTVSLNGINIDIRAMSDKVKLSNDAIDHHTLIVDTLSQQLLSYNEQAVRAAAFRGNSNAIRN